jgi:hypothetical protein
MRSFQSAAMVFLIMLTGRGGGGGSGGSAGSVATVTPTPTPSPTGTPTPTPVAANARFFTEAAGPIAGTIILLDSDNAEASGGVPSAQAYTDTSGSWLAGTTRSPYGTGVGQTSDFLGSTTALVIR